MTSATPAFLLRNPALVSASAPWCVALDSLELVAVLLAQPWLAPTGVKTAELARRLEAVSAELAVGPVYFQRVKRAIGRLRSIGVVEGLADGRRTRFRATPEGFAALVLNLRVLLDDPPLDGVEFELKRAVVARWNVAFAHLNRRPDDLELPASITAFFDRAAALEVLGTAVADAEAFDEAFDILRLIDRRRQRLLQARGETRRRYESVRARGEHPEPLDLDRLATRGFPHAAALLAQSPDETLALVQALSSSTLPALELGARLRRCERDLAYLDALGALYADVLPVVRLEWLRRRTAGGDVP